MKNKKYIYIFLIALLEITISLSLYFYFFGNKKQEPAQVSKNATSTTIIAFGDSLTAGLGLPVSESYPAQLEAKLLSDGYNVRVINAGVSGETSRGNLERAEFIRNQNPAIVILGIGGNDALRALSVVEFESNISKTIETLQSGNVPPKIVLLRMQSPENNGKEYKKKFDSVYYSVSQKYKITMIDFVVPEVFSNQSLMRSDGIHPNKEGYKILVEKYIYSKVKILLQEGLL